MKLRHLVVLTALFGLPRMTLDAQAHRSSGSLAPFESNAEVLRYLRRLIEARKAAYKPYVPPPCTGANSVASVVPAADQREAAMSDAVITGSVKWASGNSLSDAQVSIAELRVAAVTDSAGRFRLRIPADSLTKPRTVTVTARRVGVNARKHTLVIRRGDTARLDFTMCQAVLTLMEAVTTAGPAMAAKMVGVTDESVTNNQHAGVDEGGIVKLHEGHLVILRRGRLFTVAVGDRTLRPVAAVDAFGPGIEPSNDWYDELLVYGDKVVVIGYSYQRGGTEIGVFRIDRDGGLHYRATYQLRSNDYYSARNYASRLVEGKLVFYTPLYVDYGVDPMQALPAMRKWRGDTSARDMDRFEQIVIPRRVYRPARPVNPSSAITLHTVTTCDLTTDEMECDASVVIGPPARVFYVSPSSVYVWVSEGSSTGDRSVTSAVYRMPLDGSAPSAIGASGSPIDQLSFLEDGEGVLNVLVRAEEGGDAMWRARTTSSALALLRLPLESFGDGRRYVPSFRYTELPTPTGPDLQNRFVGRHLLYGTGNGWERTRPGGSDLYVVGLEDTRVSTLALSHAIDRIEGMGRDAVVIGAGSKDLQFSGIRLTDDPGVVQRFTLADASQGELRSHGFFYKPDGGSSGVVGLPVRGPGRPGYEHLVNGSASVLFLRNAGGEFRELGELVANPSSPSNDACRASCIDWYGNARPLFVRGRVFALLGYELVEGAVQADGIREVGRISYSPTSTKVLEQ